MSVATSLSERPPDVVTIHRLLSATTTTSDPTLPGSSSRPHDHGAWTSPAPTRVAGSGNRRALAWSCRHRLMARRLADVSAHSAAQPATCGVAMLVPLFVP